MEKGDGAIDITKKPVLTLVNFGDVDMKIYHNLYQSLENFFDSLRNEIDPVPEIKMINRSNPEIERLGMEEQAFFPKIDEILGKIVIGVTDIGVYRYFPYERYIFGYGSNGKGLLSTYRFIKDSRYTNKTKERLSKEIIKILSLAVGARHCNQVDCIVSFHNIVEDLDDQSLCKSCAEILIQNINYYMGD